MLYLLHGLLRLLLPFCFLLGRQTNCMAEVAPQRGLARRANEFLPIFLGALDLGGTACLLQGLRQGLLVSGCGRLRRAGGEQHGGSKTKRKLVHVTPHWNV